MSLVRESIAGIAVKARELYSEASKHFDEAMWPSDPTCGGGFLDPTGDPGRELDLLIYEQRVEALVPMIAAGLESIGAGACGTAFLRGVNEFRKAPGGLSGIEQHPEDTDIFWSPLLMFCSDHINIIEAAAGDDLLLPAMQGEIDLLERILLSTSKILSMRQIVPKKEKEVYDAVREHLEVAFTSFTRHLTFVSPLKCYKPEFGIGSIKSVVEYKLAHTKADVPKRVDELAADVHGYKPSADWKRFYAVIHMQDAWFTQKDIERQMEDRNFPANWKVIVTHQGRGSRTSARPKVTDTGSKSSIGTPTRNGGRKRGVAGT